MMSEPNFIRVEGEQESIATLTVNRPDKLNALSGDLLLELQEAVGRIGARFPTLRCLVVTGAGKAFVAGADIAAMKGMNEEQALAFSRAGHDTFAAIEALPFPVIAAVNGFALGGGCELALACDFAIASNKAKFGQPEVRLGVVPGFGGTQRLARRVGIARARELVYTGAIIDAEMAAAIGLVNEVVTPEALLPRARAIAEEIATVGPLAVREAKRVMLEGEGCSLADANQLEMAAFARCFATTDQKEGMDAFLGKRTAAFRGK